MHLLLYICARSIRCNSPGNQAGGGMRLTQVDAGARLIMSRSQISLAGVLGVMAHCGLCFGAAVSRTPIWSSLVYTLLLRALFLALLGVVFAPRSSRAFWIGFASVGWLYYPLPTLSYSD
jgi:hypothetical protein